MTNVKEDSFRDHISTVDAKGKRVWIYPKKPKGKFTSYRKWVSFGLLLLLFTAPFIRVGGEPLILLNIIDRKFILFGQIFWPQDFHLFVFLMITGIVFIILFTVVFGRLFCGWVCPQTIFMEMVFRRIEYAIEGDFKQQRLLNKRSWDFDKAWRKVMKHSLFLILSFLIGNAFLAYIIGSEALVQIISDPLHQHIGGFSSMLIFTALFYGVFAWMREQVCTTVCPYGRLQGVLLDRNSLVVAYDYIRGERTSGRAKFRKNEDRAAIGKGDCIDCGHCVDVCPTGIDIRNGTQLECVNCTACIDACDHMMDAVNLPKGLIGYKSEEGIATRTEFKFTPRVKAYSVVLALLVLLSAGLLLSRGDVETTVLRTPGVMSRELPDGRFSNLYNYKVINKSNRDIGVRFELIEINGEIEIVGLVDTLHAQGTIQGAFFVNLPKDQLDGLKTTIDIGIYEGENRLEVVSSNFLGPLK